MDFLLSVSEHTQCAENTQCALPVGWYLIMGPELTAELICCHPNTLVISVGWRALVPGSKEICQQ